MSRAQALATILVGDRYFSFPYQCTDYLKNWKQLGFWPEENVHVAPTRDPKTFSFIHRWLCGYPAHLPDTEWQTLCLIADCQFYGIPVLHAALDRLLQDQPSSLGRKARYLVANPAASARFALTSTWEEIMSFSLSSYDPLLQQTCRDLAQILEQSSQESLQILAPLLKLAAYNASWCRDLLIFLVKDVGVVLPQPDALLLLKELLLARLREAKSSPKAQPKPNLVASGSPAQSQEDEEPPGTSTESSSTRKKRHIPPPRKEPDVEFLAYLRNLQGEDSTGIRVFGDN